MILTITLNLDRDELPFTLTCSPEIQISTHFCAEFSFFGSRANESDFNKPQLCPILSGT